MSGERRVFDKEFKLMSVELSNIGVDLGALAKELDIHRRCYTDGAESFLQNRMAVFPAMKR